MKKNEIITFNLHEVIDIVNDMCELQVNGIDSAIPYLRGAPGGGKTESIRQMALDNGDLFLSCHFALKQPEDLGGIPQFTQITLDNKEILSTKWSIPEILETLIRMSEEAKTRKKKVIFFLDDIHRCGPFHVTALFELLSERKIRDIHIPDNVAIVLAGNGSIKAGAQLTNSAIINRCSIMDVHTNFNHWRTHFAFKNDFNLHILSFLQNERYQHWFHSEEDITNPWPSPRSWSKLSNILKIYLNKSKNISISKLEYICQAHVGFEATKDFITFYRIVSNFKVDHLFKEINESLSKNTINETINMIIERIQKYDDVEQFALAHAIMIEFTRYTSKERKKNNYYNILCACVFGFMRNPKNIFTEMAFSILRDIMTFIINDYKEKEEIRNAYDNIAKELNEKSYREYINDYLVKSTTDE